LAARGAVVCVSFIAILLAIADYRMNQIIARRPPLVIRISDLGKAEAVAVDDLHYAPKEAEIRYFLMNFVQLHYSRNRATLKDNFARSLYFLEAGLAAHAIEEENKSRTISAFLTGSDDEIDAQVRNVSIEDLRSPPYRATVEFDKVYHSAYDRRETKRERYVANFVFVVTDNVPNNIIPVNPLGLTMTYYREDQAFVEPRK
jgi:type IV secretory pathway component VirB8